MPKKCSRALSYNHKPQTDDTLENQSVLMSWLVPAPMQEAPAAFFGLVYPQISFPARTLSLLPPFQSQHCLCAHPVCDHTEQSSLGSLAQEMDGAGALKGAGEKVIRSLSWTVFSAPWLACKGSGRQRSRGSCDLPMCLARTDSLFCSLGAPTQERGLHPHLTEWSFKEARAEALAWLPRPRCRGLPRCTEPRAPAGWQTWSELDCFCSFKEKQPLRRSLPWALANSQSWEGILLQGTRSCFSSPWRPAGLLSIGLAHLFAKHLSKWWYHCISLGSPQGWLDSILFKKGCVQSPREANTCSSVPQLWCFFSRRTQSHLCLLQRERKPCPEISWGVLTYGCRRSVCPPGRGRPPLGKSLMSPPETRTMLNTVTPAWWKPFVKDFILCSS